MFKKIALLGLMVSIGVLWQSQVTFAMWPLPQTDSPEISHGPMSGEVTADSVVLWARGNQTGTLTFEIAATDAFTETLFVASTVVTEGTDFVGQVLFDELSPQKQYAYRVSLLTDDAASPLVTGQFKTAPIKATPFNFLFGACIGGQGYCRDPQTGWKIFEAMAATDPDFFLLTGDGLYASGACPATTNVPGAEAPATDLTSFRNRYKYHLEDESYAQFLAQVPIYVGWDDHEVRDNYSGLEMASWNPQRLQDARQSFFEYWPVTPTTITTDTYRLYRQVSYGPLADIFIVDTRSYRDPIVNWDPNPRTLEPKTMLGAEQFAWLQQSLSESQATWKFIVTSVPLSYPTGFPQPEVEGRDSWANFTDKSGYETELLGLIFYLENQNIENVVFLTGDTHWPFAISYDPDRNGEANFYEFGSSPMSAIVLPPAPNLDPTLNPTVLYADGEFQGTLFNFGQILVDETGLLTFRIIDRDGVEQYSQTITPQE